MNQTEEFRTASAALAGRPDEALSQRGDPRVLAAVEEYLAARQAGREPERQAFLARYPQIAAPLAECLDGLAFIRAAVSQLCASGLESLDKSAMAAAQPEGALGDYRLIREVGRGGMGVVYEAVQISLGRRVALKVLPFAAALDAKQLQRFKNEAQAAAHLHHQHIVPVYGVGCERGVHYYAMQFIDGHTLADFIQQQRHSDATKGTAEAASPPGANAAAAPATGPYAPALAAADTMPRAAGVVATEHSSREPAFFHTVACWGVQAAEALEHAHQLGVVHRDIKPANLLLDARGDLWITDFGLAHCRSQDGLTMTGELLGTLRYMSPEQAMGKRGQLDHRTDIYSLAATLYELVTLEAVFDGRDRQELLRQIAFDEPLPPRRRNKAIPAELETVVLKAMAKHPDERYATAQELADDLNRFLKDEQVRARRPTVMQKAKRWARRHKPVVWSAAVSAVVLLVMAVIALAVSNVWITEEKDAKDQALGEKNDALVASRASEQAARTQEQLAKKQRGIAIEQKRLAKEQELLARCRYYAAQTNLAMQAWEVGNPSRLLELLESQRPKFGQDDLRTFEWYYLWRLCQGRCQLSYRFALKSINAVAFAPDGNTLALAVNDSGALPLPPGVAEVRRLETGETWSTSAGSAIWALAFAKDGKTLALARGDGTLDLWDTTARRLRISFQHPKGGRCVAFSPDGKILASGGSDEGGDSVRFWDPDTGTQCADTLSTVAISLSFSGDGKSLATGGLDGTARVWSWDGSTCRERATLNAGGELAVAFSPDGKTLATGGAAVKLWDVQTGKQRASLAGTIGQIHALAFAPDGKTLAATANDRTVRLWNVETGDGRIVGVHAAPVLTVAFAPDGKTLASGGEDAMVRLWNLAGNQLPDSLKHTGSVDCLALPRDGHTIVAGGEKGTGVWDLANGEARAALAIPSSVALVSTDGKTRAVLAVSPDGKTLATADGTAVKLWDLPTGRERGHLEGRFPITNLCFLPDGKTLALAVGQPTSTLQLWDMASRQPRATFKLDVPAISSLAFSPDGKTLAAGGQFGWLRLWDAATGQERATLLAAEGGWARAGAVAFSADGKLVAAGNNRGVVRLWDTATGALQASFKGHTDGIRCLAFFPDGKTLASGSEDRTVRLWDVLTGQERLTLAGHRAGVTSMVIALDGSTLASGSADGMVRLWRAAAGADALARKPPLDPDDPTDPLALNSAADQLWKAGQMDEAAQTYRSARSQLEKLAAAFPDAAELRQELARSCLSLDLLVSDAGRPQQGEEARRQGQELWRNLPSDRQHALTVACKKMGDLLRAAGRHAQAQRAYHVAEGFYGQLAIDFPQETEYALSLANTRLTRAECLAWAGPANEEAATEFRDAAAGYEKLIATASTADTKAWYRHELGYACVWRGTLLRQLGQLPEAEAALAQGLQVHEKLVTDFPAVANYQYRLAWNQLHMGRVRKARGQRSEAEQAYQQAAALLEKAGIKAEFADGAYQTLDELGDLYNEEGRLADAAKAYSRAIELDPGNAGAWFKRASAYSSQAQHEKAIADYREAIRLKKDFAGAHNNLAWLLAACADPKFRDPAQAVELAKKAIELAPKEGNYWNTLGVAHYRARNWKAALAALEKSMELRKGGDAFDWLLLAMAHWQQGDKEKARTWYDRAIGWMDKNQPTDEELKRFRAEATALLAGKAKKD